MTKYLLEPAANGNPASLWDYTPERAERFPHWAVVTEAQLSALTTPRSFATILQSWVAHVVDTYPHAGSSGNGLTDEDITSVATALDPSCIWEATPELVISFSDGSTSNHGEQG